MPFLLLFMGGLILLRLLFSFLFRKKVYVHLMHLIINIFILSTLTLLLYMEKTWIFVKDDNSVYVLIFIVLIMYGFGFFQIIKDLKLWKHRDTN